MNYASLNIDTKDPYLDKAKSNNSSKPAIGAVFEYNSLKAKFGFGAQVNFTSYDFKTDYREENGVQYIEDRTEVQLNQAQIQIFFKKYFGTPDFHGYIKVGPSLNLSKVKKAFRELKDTEKTGLKRTFVYTNDPFFDSDNRLNMFLAAGVTKNLSNKLLGCFEIRGEFANTFSALSPTSDYDLSSNPITLSVGLAYNL